MTKNELVKLESTEISEVEKVFNEAKDFREV
jgi:hypothetical protein